MSEHIKSPENIVVGVGSIVEIRFMDEPTEMTEYIKIIGSHSPGPDSPTATVSIDSPLGKAIMGAKIGDTVSYPVPSGGTMSVEIISILTNHQ